MKPPLLLSISLLVLAPFAVRALTPEKSPKLRSNAPLQKVAEHRMLEPRFAPAAVAHRDFIYIIGGSDADDHPLATVERFNPRTGQSEPFAALQTGRLWHQAALVGDKIYVLGGESFTGMPVSASENAAPPNASRTLSAPGPASRSMAERIADDRAARERTELGPHKPIRFSMPVPDAPLPASALRGRHTLASVEIIDLATGKITAGPALPERRTNFACAAVGPQLFVIGGRASSAAGAIVSNRVFILDTATGTWMEGAPVPHVRSDAAAAVVSGDFVLVSGGYRKPGALAVVEVLNPRTGGWTEIAPLPRPCSAHSVAFLGHHLFLFGDYDNPGEWIAYDLNTKHSATFTLSYEPSRHTAAVVANERIFVIGGRADRHRPPTDLIQVFAPVRS